jgi:tetratricopeptide (TPR) repeat protein
MSDGGGSEDKARIARWIELFDRARDLVGLDRHAEALPLFEETLSIGRQLLEASPDDPRALQGVASPLYSMASTLLSLDRPGAAIRALGECEKIYLALGQTGQGIDIPAKLADVRARRGAAQLKRGHGASAVLDFDDAVSRYAQLCSALDPPPLLDLARVLASSAVALGRHGDPDLAVGAADRAIRIYVNGNTQLDLVSTQGLARAAEVAAEIHGECGRMDAALEADQFGIRAHEAFLAHGAVDARDDLVRSLVRAGAHLGAVGRAGDAEASRARARELDATAFAAAEKVRQQVASTPYITLRRALEISGNEASPAAFIDHLADPRDPNAPPSLSDRYVPQAAVIFAVDYAERCLRLVPTHPNEAVRLGLEAHYVFAIESRRQTMQMRYQLADFGPHWARALLACAALFAMSGYRAMAEDLAGWLRGVALGLAPFSYIQPEIAKLVEECSTFTAEYPATDGA